jgi:hypothetical protein
VGRSGKRFYDDISFTGIFYGAAGDNTSGVTVENNVKHDIWRIGGGAFFIREQVIHQGGGELYMQAAIRACRSAMQRSTPGLLKKGD